MMNPIILLLISLCSFAQEKVKVAVIDTGFNNTHPEYKNRVILNEENKLKSDSINDEEGHGTHVAGIILRENEFSKVIPIKFLDRKHMVQKFFHMNSDTEHILKYKKAIELAIKNEAKIINISGTINHKNEDDLKIIKNNPQVLFVVASGNQFGSGPSDIDLPKSLKKTNYGIFPCHYQLPNVICVGSVDNDQDIKSNWGENSIDVFAQGENVLSLYLEGKLSYLSGSSMATPKISAELARIWANNPKLSSIEVKKKMMSNLKYSKKLKPYSKTGKYLPE